MPSTSSRRSAATDHASGPNLTRVMRPPVRVAVTPAPASQGTPANAADECSICLVELSVKRTVSLQPCAHRLHSSCCRRWMETREYTSEQSCPICRTRTRTVIDEGGGRMAILGPGFPYGETGEPTREMITRGGQPPATLLGKLLHETKVRLARWEPLEKNDAKGELYIQDVKSELQKLKMRRDTLVRMKGEVERGEWAAVVEEDSDDDEEDIRVPMTLFRQLRSINFDMSRIGEIFRAGNPQREAVEEARETREARRAARAALFGPPTRRSARIAAMQGRGAGGAQQQQ